MTRQTDPAEIIQEKILQIITTKQDEMFDEFDRLHAKGIHDDEVVAALRALHEEELLDHYADWADLDLRDPEQRLPDGVVPDPGTNPSDLQMQQTLAQHPIADTGIPAPRGDRELEAEILALGNEYLPRFHDDPIFHAKSVAIGRFLDQLERLHQAGDHQRVGFLITAMVYKADFS